jgi:hypothetical protein
VSALTARIADGRDDCGGPTPEKKAKLRGGDLLSCARDDGSPSDAPTRFEEAPHDAQSTTPDRDPRGQQ